MNKQQFLSARTTGLLVLFLMFGWGNLFTQEWRESIEKENPTFFEIRDSFYKHYGLKGYKHPGQWKQFKRWEWFSKSRLNTDGRLDPTLNWKGWLEKQDRFDNQQRTTAGGWTQLGPVQIPATYNTRGRGGMGRVNCITFDPVNPDVIWIGSPAGGLWKTTDGGATWANFTDYLPNLGVSSILIHPGNSNIMYIATGDGDALDTRSIGVFKSMDAGATWNVTGISPLLSERYAIRKLMMHPNNPDIIIGVFNKGIYKTSDGGATWSSKTVGNFHDLEVDPSDPDVWYASSYKVGVFKSTDSGETWFQLSSGLPNSQLGPDVQFGRIALALCRNSPHIVYALYVNSEQGFYGLYRSTDSGNSWVLRSNSPNLLGWAVSGNDSGGQGWYDLTLGVQPDNSDVIYIGGVNMWKSVNGGATWTIKGHWSGGLGTAYVHADHHAFAFHPNDSNILFSANDGGLFKSTDAGTSWMDLSGGLAIHQIYRIGVAEKDADIMVIGTQDNGSDLFLGGGWKSIFGGDGMECAVDPVDSSIMYCSVYYGSFKRSSDSGKTWADLNGEFDGEAAWVAPFALDPQTSSILYTAALKVYKSTSIGSWTAISPELSQLNITSLAVAPSDSNYIYAANEEGFVYVTTDGGANWSTYNPSILPGNISDLAAHPGQPATVYLTCGGYTDGLKVFKSMDAGASWINISGPLPNIPANCIAIDPLSYSVYLGTDLGVFYAAAGGSSWTAFDGGLPNVVVSDLDIHSNSGKIRAATYGRGVWESLLVEQPLIFPPDDFAGERHWNRAFLFDEYLDALTWNPGAGNHDKSVATYNIYRVKDGTETLLTTLPAGTHQYYARKVENQDNTYGISTTDDQGNESIKIYIIVK